MLAQELGAGVTLIDSAEETAAETARTLGEQRLRASSGTPRTLRFIASDAPEQFLRVGQRFLGTAIERVEKHTLG